MMMKHMCGVCKATGALVVIGALNWGLVGAFNFNLVNALLGAWPVVERVVYVVVGLAAIAHIFSMMGKCKKCAQCKGGECKGGECKGGACKGGSCSGEAGSSQSSQQ